MRGAKVARFTLEITPPDERPRVLHVNGYDSPTGYVWIGEGDGACYGCLRDRDVQRLHNYLGVLLKARKGRAGKAKT